MNPHFQHKMISWLIAISRFKRTRALRSPYWIGLDKSAGSNLYYWSDGAVVNSGNVSDANPCESLALAAMAAPAASCCPCQILRGVPLHQSLRMCCAYIFP